LSTSQLDAYEIDSTRQTSPSTWATTPVLYTNPIGCSERYKNEALMLLDLSQGSLITTANLYYSQIEVQHPAVIS